MRRLTTLVAVLATLALASSCVYRANISQGNFIEQDDVDQLAIGMTRSQVRFLLGTPLIDDPFHAERWDYVYYLKVGRQEVSFKRWLTVVFDDEAVIEIRKDQDLQPDI